MSGAAGKQALLRVDAAGLAVCLACLGAWYALGLAPLTEARAMRAALVGEVAAQEATLAEMEGKRKEHEEGLQGLLLQISQVRTPLQSADHINSRLKSVTDLAAECSLQIDEIRPGSPTVLEHYTGVPIRVAGEGSYEAATKFLHMIQQRYRDLGVTGFELRGEPTALDKPTTFVVQLLWYASPLPK